MKAIFIFWVILFLPSIFFAQGENKEAPWTRIESPKGDLTFTVPPDFLIDNEGEEYRAIASRNKITMSVIIQAGGKAKARLVQMRQYAAKTEARVSRLNDGDSTTEAQISHFTNGDFIGDIYKYENEKSFSMNFYLASSKAFYIISVSTKNLANPALEKFVYSITLDNRPLVKQEIQPSQTEDTKISIVSLKTSPIITEALRRKDAAKSEIKYDLSSKGKPEEDVTEYSRSLIVLRKPKPAYTDDARQNGIQGAVKVNVVFRANGEIGEMTVLSKLDGGLVRNVADAIRKIKFLPAEVNGKSVDVSRIVEYTFTIY